MRNNVSGERHVCRPHAPTGFSLIMTESAVALGCLLLPVYNSPNPATASGDNIT